MSLSPLATIDNELYSSIREYRPIKMVLVGPELWLGFLLQIDLPGSSDQLMKISYLDGLDTVKKYLKKTFRAPFYLEEYPFFIKLNKHITGVRVILYPPIP